MSALLVDIGNSRIKWRTIDEQGRAIADSGALALADLERLADLWVTLRPERAIVSNVAGERVGAVVDRTLRSLVPDVPIEHVVPVLEAAGVINGYRDVAQLGPDRWLAMIAAHALWPDQALLVCSFGTATTIDLLSSEAGDRRATFRGGLILPGVETMRHALVRDTARLVANPGKIVDFADNTDDAIASGIAMAQIGAVRAALRHARPRGASGPLACIVAGGASGGLLESLETLDVPIHLAPDLVLHGLAVFAADARLQRASVDETITIDR
jgi:type III pantothenate kinase